MISVLLFLLVAEARPKTNTVPEPGHQNSSDPIFRGCPARHITYTAILIISPIGVHCPRHALERIQSRKTMSRRRAYNASISARGLRPYLDVQRGLQTKSQTGIEDVQFKGYGDDNDDGDGIVDVEGDVGGGRIADANGNNDGYGNKAQEGNGDGKRVKWYGNWKWASLGSVMLLFGLLLLAAARTLRFPSTIITTGHVSVLETTWLLSTAAQMHVTTDRSMFVTFHTRRSASGVGTAESYFGESYRVGLDAAEWKKQRYCTGYGTVVVQFPTLNGSGRLVLDEVCYAGKIEDNGDGDAAGSGEGNVISVGRLASQGISMQMVSNRRDRLDNKYHAYNSSAAAGIDISMLGVMATLDDDFRYRLKGWVKERQPSHILMCESKGGIQGGEEGRIIPAEQMRRLADG